MECKFLFKQNSSELIAVKPKFKEIDLKKWWKKVRRKMGFIILDFDSIYLKNLNQEDMFKK